MDVELDQVSPVDAQMYRVGGHDLDRIAFDKTKVDPVTHKVPIACLAHYIGGRWMETTPTDSSSLDLSSKPYRLNFVEPANHGSAIVIVFEGEDRRMAILSRPDFSVLIAGKYTIDPSPLTPAQIAAPPPHANSPGTMPILSGMPQPPAGSPKEASAGTTRK
jgi:hypothetical protein